MGNPKVINELCIACEICIEVCPIKIISIQNGTAIITPKDCKNCRACEMVCPTSAIK